MKIGLLISGSLGYNAFCDLIKNKKKIVFVFTDSLSDNIVNFAKEKSIPIFIGNPRKGNPDEFLKQFKTDIILSVNYLFIVGENILSHPKILAVNLHGSLLPKYRGRTPHVWSIINGENKTGVTAHIMEEGCDEGDIIVQKEIEIEENDTGADILNKYKIVYPSIISELIQNIEGKNFCSKKQDSEKATFFSKRTPDDGQINWEWSKERIRNWIRAQAHPYPGAFTFYENNKITIDQVEYSDYGFDSEMPNGLILSVSPKLLIKVCNGVIEINSIRDIKNFTFKKNKLLK